MRRPPTAGRHHDNDVDAGVLDKQHDVVDDLDGSPDADVFDHEQHHIDVDHEHIDIDHEHASSTTSTTSSTTSTTTSSIAPGGSTTTDPGATTTSIAAPGSSTTDPASTSTTEGTDVEDDELPYTGLKVPAWLLALIGVGLLLSGSGLVRIGREGDNPRGR